MIRIISLISILWLLTPLCATPQTPPAPQTVGVEYLKNFYGHVHQSPNRYSESLTAIACGHPVKITNIEKNDWIMVKVGPYEGYIEKNNLEKKRPICFQEKFPKFFNLFELDPSDQYYWGKLFVQYVQGQSKIK